MNWIQDQMVGQDLSMKKSTLKSKNDQLSSTQVSSLSYPWSLLITNDGIETSYESNFFFFLPNLISHF